MDIDKTLADLNAALITTPETVQMTKVQFLAHAKSELEKAAEEEKDDKEKAKKRLAVLQANVAKLQKSSWEGTEAQPITIFKDPGQADTTETETPANASIDGTAGDGKTAFENPGDISGKNPGTAGGGALPAIGAGTQGDKTYAENSVVGKALTAVNKALASLELPPAATTAATTNVKPIDGGWPADVNSPSFMKEGKNITKAASDLGWGSDPK